MDAPRPTRHMALEWTTLAALGATALLVFGWLARETAEGDRFGWDLRVLGSLAKVENGAFEAAMVVFAFLGAGAGLLILLSAVVAVLLRQRRTGDALFVVLALATAQVAERIVKAAIDKPRPGRTDHELVHGLADMRPIALGVVAALVLLACTRARWRRGALGFAAIYVALFVAFEYVLRAIVGPQEGVAFPSGHATSSMTVVAASAVVLAWPSSWRWPSIAIGAAFAIGVGLSRVAFGVHEPSDVLGGWLLALATVAELRLAMTGLGSARRSLRARRRLAES